MKYIKWTFEPVKARNGYFNLEKLGAIVCEYQRNFYGTDYAVSPESGKQIGLQSDRLFAEWHLESDKVTALARGEKYIVAGEPGGRGRDSQRLVDANGIRPGRRSRTAAAGQA